MMKKIKMLLLAMGMGLSALGHAAGYGVVDLAKVVENSTYLKQQNTNLGQTIKPSTTKLEQLSREIEALKKQAQTAPATEVAQLQTQYQAKVDEFNQIQQQLQKTVQGILQTMNKTMESRVKQAAEQLRQENKLDFVLNKNSALAYDAKYDLTDKMIQKVNTLK